MTDLLGLNMFEIELSFLFSFDMMGVPGRDMTSLNFYY